jgi:hypothetical protein
MSPPLSNPEMLFFKNESSVSLLISVKFDWDSFSIILIYLGA